MHDLSPQPGDLDPIETAPVEQLRVLQLERLQWSVRHAYDNVAHYRQAFDEARVRPGDIGSLEDLARLPFTTAVTLRDNYPFGMFAVRPDGQGAGLGKALQAAAEDHARAGGATTMELCVIDRRAELIAWYERRGYVRTGATRPFPYGEPGVGFPHDDDLRFAVLTKSLTGPPRS